MVGAVAVTFGSFWLMLQRAEEVGNTAGFMVGCCEGERDCNELGCCRPGRGRLGVGIRLKGEAMAGNGLGGE